MNEAEFYILRLMNYYSVDSISALSLKIETSQQSITNWKIRNSVSAIEKKCRTLGIYKEVFDVAYDPRPFQIGISNDNSTFNQIGKNQQNVTNNDLTPQEKTLLECFRKAPEEFKNQILIFALGGKP